MFGDYIEALNILKNLENIYRQNGDSEGALVLSEAQNEIKKAWEKAEAEYAKWAEKEAA